MNVGIYVCVILAALSSGSLSLPPQSVRAESPAHLNSLHAPPPNQKRQVRLASGPQSVLHRYHGPVDPLNNHSRLDAPQPANKPQSFLDRLVRRQILPPLVFWTMTQRFSRKKKN